MQNREEWLKKHLNLMNRASLEKPVQSRLHGVDGKEDVKLSCGFGYNRRGGKANAKVYTPDQ